MYSEIKYDGERVQVHKNGDVFSYFSRSLKPVLPHKVSEYTHNTNACHDRTSHDFAPCRIDRLLPKFEFQTFSLQSIFHCYFSAEAWQHKADMDKWPSNIIFKPLEVAAVLKLHYIPQSHNNKAQKDPQLI